MEKSFIEEARTRARLSDLVRPHTKLRPCSGGFMGLCCFHKERTASFHVSDLRGTYKCFSCGESGDIFDFLMKTRGLTFPEAVEELSRDAVTGVADFRHQTQASHEKGISEDEKRRIAHAHEIWLKRGTVPGTLASQYLRTRGITGNIPEVLGYVPRAYCSPLKEEVPALIAPLQDSAGHVTAVQQIFLCSETQDAWRDPETGRRIKRTLGMMKDGCVRLGLPDTTLGLAGSVEDALAASILFSLPVWATCGEARLERVWVPPEITELVIFADADAAGKKAANDAALRHWGKRSVTIHYPDGQKDWCGIAEVRGAV